MGIESRAGAQPGVEGARCAKGVGRVEEGEGWRGGVGGMGGALGWTSHGTTMEQLWNNYGTTHGTTSSLLAF